MSACPGCGGTVGRDCFNPADCAWIAQDMRARAEAAAFAATQPVPCQGCSEITGTTRDCLGLCAGLSSDADIEARAVLWRAIPATFAAATT